MEVGGMSVELLVGIASGLAASSPSWAPKLFEAVKTWIDASRERRKQKSEVEAKLLDSAVALANSFREETGSHILGRLADKDTIVELTAKVASLEAKHGALEEKYAALDAANTALREDYDALFNSYAELCDRYDELVRSYEALRNQYEALEKQRAVDNSTYTSKLSSAMRRISQLEEERDVARRAIEQKSAELRRANEQLERLRAAGQ